MAKVVRCRDVGFDRDGQVYTDNLQKIFSGSPLMVILRP